MKKIISLLLVLAMVMALAACGAAKPAETQAPETEAPVVEAPATEAPETEAPKEGCGSTVAFAAVALMTAAAAFTVKKKD